MVALELHDIQGNILRGYGFGEACYMFFEVPDAESGRSFLAELVVSVQNGAEWESPPETATNIAVTYAGLRALGVGGAVLDELPAAFCEPIRERAAQLLDDTGPSAPEHWDPGLGTERTHILVTVNGRKIGSEAYRAETTRVRACAVRHGLEIVHKQPATALDNRREHFGWADGFGQPSVAGTTWGKKGDGMPLPDGTWRDVKAGEFVLGYADEDHQTVSGHAASMLRNGTYMVYRKLYQNVAAFRKQLYDDAQKYGMSLSDQPPLDPDQLYELMAAKVVGRWRDGMPIAQVQRRADHVSRKLGARALPEPSNNFRYYTEDSLGLKCPLGAHIRRTNPRDALGWNGDGRMALRHRIIRRGMPYGKFLEGPKDNDQDHGLQDDGEDRGLIFVCFQADFERQFEVVQRLWCNDGNAFGLGNDKDYLLGDPTWAPPVEEDSPPIPLPDGRLSTCRVTIQGKPPHFVKGQAPVVLTRGCEYLLMPGIEALRGLANGRWAAPGEAPPPGEHAAIERVVSLTKEKYERDNPPTGGLARRDQHAKAHGCVRAELVVASDVPAALRHGIFREPGTYPAWIRFSSSAPTPKPDSKRDAHGMAVKVMDVQGADGGRTTQDFVLANAKVFFCRNAKDYVELATRASEGKFLRFFLGWNPTKWRLRELVNMLVATQKKVDNPLQIQYWSQTPSALGPHAVKYSARPRSGAKDHCPAPEGADYLEDAMKRQLATGECRFDFMVQVQADPTTMPVEDPTIPWKERRSPFQTVATLRIPSQDFTSDAQKAFAENLTFTPWRGLAEHRPLGGINRVRRAVYAAISEMRHERNGVPEHEPAGDEVP